MRSQRPVELIAANVSGKIRRKGIEGSAIAAYGSPRRSHTNEHGAVAPAAHISVERNDDHRCNAARRTSDPRALDETSPGQGVDPTDAAVDDLYGVCAVCRHVIRRIWG